MEKTFKIGDVVRLKSGGPPMTVVRTNDGYDDGHLVVGWYADGGDMKAQHLPPDALETCGPVGRSAAVDEALVR